MLVYRTTNSTRTTLSAPTRRDATQPDPLRPASPRSIDPLCADHSYLGRPCTRVIYGSGVRVFLPAGFSSNARECENSASPQPIFVHGCDDRPDGPALATLYRSSTCRCSARLYILCWRELSRRRLLPAVSPAAGYLTTPTVAGVTGLCENFRPTTSKSSPI